MTRTVPSGLQTHLDGATTSTATLWRITRQDGAVLRFTDHDQDISFGGNVYAAAVGYQRTDISGSATLSVDSLDVEGILNSAEISETDLRGGRYDYAQVRIALVNWKDPDGDGEVSLRTGWFGEIIYDENSQSFSTELRGLTQVFQQNIIEAYGRPCRYNVGDGRCNRDNTVPILADEIRASTAYALGDVVRVPAVGASVPPITVDYGDTHYVVTTAGTTGAGVNNFPTVLSSAATPATTLDVDDTNTISRASGSFLTDGWEVDMVFTSTGFTDAANNGNFRIAAVTATTIDVSVSTLVAESGTGDEVLTHVAHNNGVVFSVGNALRVAGEVLFVNSQSEIVVGPPGGPGGGLLASPLYIENAGFETGDLTGWTITDVGNDPGNAVVTMPVRTGTYACEIARGWSGPGGNTEMTQTRDVSDYAAPIDAGGQTITVTWWQHGDGGAAGQLNIDFDYLDNVDAVISTTEGTPKLVIADVYQQQTQVSGILPVGTRKVVISAVQDTGASGDMFVDDFAVASTLVDPIFPDDEFNYGVMTFDSGLNAGLSMDVKDYDALSKTFTLYLPMPYPMAVGDKIGVHIGCNKELSRCQALGNELNHGGFPFIPGDDAFLRYPDSPY